jgi:hypothetical protein
MKFPCIEVARVSAQVVLTAAIRTEEDGMNTNHGDRGLNATRSRNSAGCQLKRGFFLVGLAVLIRLAHPTAAFASETDNGPAITVLVFNYREVPVETLVKAEREAGRILDQAGVRVTWRDCPTGNETCRKGPGRVFFLAMMAGPMQNKFLDTVSGYAVLPDHLAVVYYDYLPRIPGGQSSLSDTAVILGCVIAHELGHLLLGTHRHSIAGIMQERWAVEQTRIALMSRLSFLPEEARLMHAGTVTPEAKDNSTSALTSH